MCINHDSLSHQTRLFYYKQKSSFIFRYLTLKKSVKMFTTENIFKSELLYQKRNYDILE